MSYCYACDRFVAKPIIIEHRRYCQRCARQSPDYADEVTARIDAVIREDDWCGYGEDTSPEPDETSTVPLAEQIAQYGERVEAVLDALHDNLEDEWFRTAVIRLGVERLTEGYADFGDAMYDWDADKRDDEMFEELADYLVYGTSGPFFDVRSAR